MNNRLLMLDFRLLVFVSASGSLGERLLLFGELRVVALIGVDAAVTQIKDLIDNTIQKEAVMRDN